MRRGFLGSHKAPSGAAPSTCLPPRSDASVEDTSISQEGLCYPDKTANATGGGAPSSSPQPGLTREQLDVRLGHCLKLLKSDSDESRFAGLLLVAKLLPQGDERVSWAVYQAVGAKFLRRLLAPLGSKNKAAGRRAADSSDTLRDGCALGLAMTSALCRSSVAVAGSEEMQGIIPYLVAVLRNGGVEERDPGELRQAAEPSPTTDEDGMSGKKGQDGVQDAMEALVHVCHCNADAAVVALQCGVVDAAQGMARMCKEAGRKHYSMLYLQLMSAVLEAQDPVQQLPAFVAHVDDGAPGLEAVAATAAELFGTMPEGGAGAEAAGGMQAATHLQSMHVLLLLLRPVAAMSEQASPLPGRLATLLLGDSTAGLSPAAAQIAAGLGVVFSSRLPGSQKAEALQLCAAATELAGPRLLLGALQQRGHGQAAEARALLEVLVEVLRVETGLSLRDSMEAASLAAAAGGKEERDRAAQLQERVRAVLPACLLLVEAGVNALIHSSDMLPCASLARLSDSAAFRAMEMLDLIAVQLLEFLEAAQECWRDLAGAAAAAAAPALDPLLEKLDHEPGRRAARLADAPPAVPDASALLAAARCLMVFLQQVPEAHAVRAQSLLPFLAVLPDDPGMPLGSCRGTAAAAFALPLLLQGLAAPAHAAGWQAAVWADGGAFAEAAGLLADASVRQAAGALSTAATAAEERVERVARLRDAVEVLVLAVRCVPPEELRPALPGWLGHTCRSVAHSVEGHIRPLTAPGLPPLVRLLALRCSADVGLLCSSFYRAACGSAAVPPSQQPQLEPELGVAAGRGLDAALELDALAGGGSIDDECAMASAADLLDGLPQLAAAIAEDLQDAQAHSVGFRKHVADDSCLSRRLVDALAAAPGPGATS